MIPRLKFKMSTQINRMLDEIEQSIFVSDSTMFLDTNIGGGQFVKEIEKRLRKYGHSDANIKNRVFGFERSSLWTGYAINKHKLVGTYNYGNPMTLIEGINMKFDLIIGNDPYQKDTGNKGAGQSLWDMFIKRCRNDLLNEDGVMAKFHPAGWRQYEGSFQAVSDIYKNMDILYLNINNIEQGKELFGYSTRYDIVVAKNSYTDNLLTKVHDELGTISNLDLKQLDFIPNFNFDILENLLAKSGEEPVELISERSMYPLDKVSLKKTSEYSLPCVKYVHKGTNEIDIVYTNEDKGMFGKPKVMFGTMAQVGGIIIDDDGTYGMCQYTAGIVDTKENLPHIQKALKSEKFKKVMESVQFTTQSYNAKIISLMKKDFWKEFV